MEGGRITDAEGNRLSVIPPGSTHWVCDARLVIMSRRDTLAWCGIGNLLCYQYLWTGKLWGSDVTLVLVWLET